MYVCMYACQSHMTYMIDISTSRLMRTKRLSGATETIVQPHAQLERGKGYINNFPEGIFIVISSPWAQDVN